MRKLPDYDVVIIGAGIGGLVCGCFLAKNNIRTLIIEQDLHVGGYCTSFQRNGYRFDSAIHYLGGVKHGILRHILTDLNLNSLRFNQFDPTDKIILNDSSTFFIRADAEETISGFLNKFPKDRAGIRALFKFVTQNEILKVYCSVRKLTFKQLLDKFVTDKTFAHILNGLFYGNMGLPIEKISAFAAISFIRQFLLDPGYYPAGGMQAFSDAIANQFKQHGGKIILGSKVTKILTKEGSASGIVTNKEEKITAQFIVSNTDALVTFGGLLRLKTNELKIARGLKLSVPIFGVFLGIKSNLEEPFKQKSNLWQLNSNSFNRSFSTRSVDTHHNKLPIIMSFFPSSHDASVVNKTVQIFTLSFYETRGFWSRNRDDYASAMINCAEKVIPGLSSNINLRFNATPYTFQRYTANSHGAAYGWASIPDQIDPTIFPQKTSVPNLYLAGHWTTIGGGQGGVSPSALSGIKAARSIINKLK